MKTMKKILSYIGCAVTAWAGLYFAVIADVSDNKPYDQGGLSIIAAILFCASILFAGYGNSTKWKKAKR